MSLPQSLIAILPVDSIVQEIAYVSSASASQNVLLDLPLPIKRRAVLVESAADGGDEESIAADLVLVSIPCGEPEAVGEDLLAGLRKWVDTPTHPGALAPGLMMTLQGAQILWSPRRVAILADSSRLEAIRRTLIEVTYYLSALSAIEHELSSDWPQLDEDMPLAFQFNERGKRRLKELKQRSLRVLMLRARLAQITPFLLAPHVYPPTLASQIGERLRERTQVIQREESLSDQIEVFEDVYEMCSQRSSDYMLARSGHMLEWIIIVLLGVQIVFSLFDIISTMGT